MPGLTSFTFALLLAARAAIMTAEPTAALAVVQDESDQYVGQIYDIRDLTLLTSVGKDEGDAHVTAVVNQLCNAIGLSISYVMPGLVWVEGAPQDHQTLQSSIASIRSLYKDRFELQLLVMPVEADEVPAIGAAVKPSRSIYASRQVISASQPAVVRSVTTYHYVHGFEPVVGDNASGYSTIIEEATEGLEVNVAVDPARAGEDSIAIDVRGAITSVDFTRTMPFIGGEDGMRINLPTFSERTFESHLTLRPGELTALSVVDDFEGEGAIVIAAMVKKVK